MLTELALIFCVDFAALIFAGLLARWALRLGAGDAGLRRLATAAMRAAEAFLWRENKVVARVVVVVCAAFAAAYWALEVGPAASLRVKTLSFIAGAILAGAVAACAAAYFCAQMTLRGAARAAVATRVGVDHATAVAMRTGGIVGVVTDAFGVVGITLLLALVYLLEGGPALGAAELGGVLDRISLTIPGFGVGVAVVSLVLGLGGNAYYLGGKVGGTLIAEVDAGLEPGDTRNPALVADLVGEQVGIAVTRAIDLMTAGALGNVAALLVGIAAFRAGGSTTNLWGLVTLPLVVRSLGVAATGFGLMSTRAKESEGVRPALWRGELTTAVVSLGGLAGAAYWLLGPSLWTPFFGAGLLGLIAASLMGHAARYGMGRSFSPLRQVLEASRFGAPVTVARGLSHGLSSVGPPLVLLGAALTAAWHVGEGSDLDGGGLLALAIALNTSLASGGFVLALGLLGPIAGTARSIGSVDGPATRSEGRRLAGQLDDAGFEASSVAQTFFIAVGGAAAMVAAMAFSAARPGTAAMVTSRHPAVLLGGLLGAAVVLGFAGAALSAAARAAKASAAEVERQLRGFPRRDKIIEIPEDYTPSYRAVVDQSSRAALERLFAPVGIALAVPAVLGIGLRLLYRSGDLAADALASFVVIASATGLATALATEGARVVLCAAHRANRPRGSYGGFEVSVTGHAVADLIGSSAAPAAHSVAKACAMTALLILPLVT